MRQFRLLVFVSLGVVVFGAVTAVSASARKNIPGIVPIVLFPDKSGVSKFVSSVGLSGAVIECASSTSTGGFETSLLGTFDVLFLKCLVNVLAKLFLCTGLSDTVTSSVLVLGTFHLRYREATGTKSVVAFLIIPAHFTCKEGTTEKLIEVMGCAAGEITPVNKSVVTGEHFTMEMKKSSTASRNEITKIVKESGSGEETCQLESKEGTGAFGVSAEETTDEIVGNASSAKIEA